MNNLSKFSALTLALTLATSHLMANDGELHAIDEVVVTATGSPRRLKESPVPIAVITSDRKSVV